MKLSMNPLFQDNDSYEYFYNLFFDIRVRPPHSSELSQKIQKTNPSFTLKDLSKHLRSLEDNNFYVLDETCADKIRKHIAYITLNDNLDYGRALNTFKKTNYYKNYSRNDAGPLAELVFAFVCATEIHNYQESKKHPDKLVIKKAGRNDVICAIDNLNYALQENIKTPLLFFEKYRLIKQMNRLRSLLDSSAPSLIPKTNKGWVPERHFVHRLTLSYKFHFDTFAPSLVSHILKSVGVDHVYDHVIDDWLSAAKRYWNHIDNKEKINRTFSSPVSDRRRIVYTSTRGG